MKRFISILLTIALLISAMILPAFATSPFTTYKQAIIEALQDIEPNKDLFGYSDISFTNVKVGNGIHVYELVDNALEEVIMVYPLFDGDKLFAFATPVPGGHFQIDTFFVEELSPYMNGEIAIVYDSEGRYVYDGSAFTLLGYSSMDTSFRSPLSAARSVISAEEIVLSDWCESTTLGYQPGTQSRLPYFHCPVQYITQFIDELENSENGSLICWAATTACISNYVRGTILDARQVAIMATGSTTPSGYNVVASEELALYAMNSICLLNYTFVSYAPTTAQIISNIMSEYPIYGRFACVPTPNYTGAQELGHHDCTIFGIDTGSNFVSVMDPEHGPTAAYMSSYGYSCYNHNGAVLLVLALGALREV